MSNRRWKRIRGAVSFVMICLLVLGTTITIVPTTVFATGVDGEGTPAPSTEESIPSSQNEISEPSTEEKNVSSGNEGETPEPSTEGESTSPDNEKGTPESSMDGESGVTANDEGPIPSSTEEGTTSQESSESGEVATPSDDKESEISGNEKESEVLSNEDEAEKEVSEEDIGSGELPPIEAAVPIYNYEIVNVVAPAVYAMALNPYELPVKIGEDAISTAQVVSKKYGIINKSSTDKIVTVTLTVEDLNGDKITFVDSAEQAENADEDTYAVYLAIIPAANSEVKIGGDSADMDTTAEDLSDVAMEGAENCAVALHAGENQIAFKLSKAVYDFEGGNEIILDGTTDDDMENLLKLSSLAPDGTGVTAFTFDGTMNKKADWGELLRGIKISAVYSYKTANGDEEVIVGTGAMIDVD